MFRVHNDAASDLRAIRAADPEAFGRLFALLEQLKSDPTWIDKLLDHGYGSDRKAAVPAPFGVMKWRDVQRYANLPVWRLKFWDLERSGLKYRLVYLYYWRDKSYNLMAIVRRDKFDYDDPNDPTRLRVIARCRFEFPGA